MADVAKKHSVIWDDAPKVYKSNDHFDVTSGENPARYLVNPGAVTAPGRHSAGALRHARPYIVSGNIIFVFPVGVEGFRRAGQATLGLHRYIGWNAVAAQTIMREEGRITLTGTFPGSTGQSAMVNCENILRSAPNAPGLVLYAPGVFEVEQYVVAETWEFSHEGDDRTHSVDYNITFVRVGEGKKVADPHGAPAPTNPTTKRRKASKPSHIFTVRSGVQTFRQIAKAVYGNSNSWQRLVTLNPGLVVSWHNISQILSSSVNIPTYKLPDYRWKVGTKIKY